MANMANGSPTLLMIEDNEISRAGMSVVLRRAGYRVVAVGDGRQAMNYLQTGSRPDLILLDMLMPVMDGWEFLRNLRQWPEAPSVPVVITTGTILTREWADQHGCAGFLHKPFETDHLLAEVQRCLKCCYHPR